MSSPTPSSSSSTSPSSSSRTVPGGIGWGVWDSANYTAPRNHDLRLLGFTGECERRLACSKLLCEPASSSLSSSFSSASSPSSFRANPLPSMAAVKSAASSSSRSQSDAASVASSRR